MFRNTALVLLGIFIATTNADEQDRQLVATCPEDVPSGSCADMNEYKYCFYNEAHDAPACVSNSHYQCHCEGWDTSMWVCSCRGDGTLDAGDSIDVEEMDVTVMEVDSSSAAATTVVSSLMVSGAVAVAATVFGL